MRLFNYVDRGRLLKVYGKSVFKYGTPRKIWNALRTEWAYRTRRIDVRTPPYILFIEPIYYCNLKCPLCPREKYPDARSDDKSRLPLDLLDKVFDEIGDYLFQCQIFGNGEPMLDWPRTKHVIQTAHRRKIYTLISTNCTIMTPKLAEEVVTSGLDYLICAVDGTSQEAYEKYRVGGRHDKAMAGMRMLVEAAKRSKSDTFLEWQFLVNRHTYPQMAEARRLAEEMGIYIRFSPIGGVGLDEQTKAEWYAPDPQWRNTEQAPGKPLNDFHCYWLWRSLVINSNGNLARCPGFSNIAQMASLHENSIMSVYNGAQSQRARELFSKGAVEPGEFPTPCADCMFYARHHGGSGTSSTTPDRKRVPLPLAPSSDRGGAGTTETAEPAVAAAGSR